MNNKINKIIDSAKEASQGKSEAERYELYDKYKYQIYDLTKLGEQQPYIKRLIDALNI